MNELGTLVNSTFIYFQIVENGVQIIIEHYEAQRKEYTHIEKIGTNVVFFFLFRVVLHWC